MLAVAAAILIYFIWLYNRLVRGRNSLEAAESDVTVQLKRRYDLIPSLVETVKSYVKHERETLEAVVDARSAAMSASGSTSRAAREAENILEGALKSLFALAENYPDLKASSNFLKLQEELVDTEDKIQAARRFYNSSLRGYADQLQMFPSVLVAQIFSFDTGGRDYFEVSDAAAVAQPPKVEI